MIKLKRMLLLVPLISIFLFSSYTSANIVIKGSGNQLQVQVDDGACIEFKMQTTDSTSIIDGKTQTQSITEYKYWRPCGSDTWIKYEKGQSPLGTMEPSSTHIFKPPKYRKL